MGQELSRFEDWPERLDDYIKRDFNFDWTTCNCALFAAGAVEAMTGVDLAKEYKGGETKTEVLRQLKNTCGGDVVDAVTKELGQPLNNINIAKRGDVVSCLFPDGVALGICVGIYGIFITEQNGKIMVPLINCIDAWSVG